ncbi:hypothetical protein BD310DRAFT_485627 [Dichomitus squalens]|uniref:Uncharacterized protein n=1 Tax=Dichomitus squalens TaxID=114155 RepID=A0A4Q9PVG2_9APHY|nr:hypothetical protein BD310DRAFT_485627 [Dichomitus squalens]
MVQCWAILAIVYGCARIPSILRRREVNPLSIYVHTTKNRPWRTSCLSDQRDLITVCITVALEVSQGSIRRRYQKVLKGCSAVHPHLEREMPCPLTQTYIVLECVVPIATDIWTWGKRRLSTWQIGKTWRCAYLGLMGGRRGG